ncbi:hypothetical protein HOU14_gp13 [Dickeya phage Luksen]|uniref:Uncharacterized protein n=1 Tax=Dickeya phage Luksen TaxID=2320192 RepID=A0A385IFQ1_9CAUD|nr:hypothetical protein HOU14_gp13 [Dickeya phage Luksen]AXY81838.1 hypothetical protein [Dickeya phage Luksen]
MFKAILFTIMIILVGVFTEWKYALAVWAVIFIGNSIKYRKR